MAQKVQFILLGNGHIKFHLLFKEIAHMYPSKTSINIKYDPQLAQRIYAGADMFLMPSRYEPCGLGQLISLRYGTIPIVRKTGGLADTIINYEKDNELSNGFNFINYTVQDLTSAIKRALELYMDKKAWQELIQQAMIQDFSWEQSAQEYCLPDIVQPPLF